MSLTQLCAQDLFFPQSHEAILSSPASWQCHQQSTTSNYSLEFRGVLGARSTSKHWHSERAEKDSRLIKFVQFVLPEKQIRRKINSVLLLYWYNLALSAVGFSGRTYDLVWWCFQLLISLWTAQKFNIAKTRFTETATFSTSSPIRPKCLGNSWQFSPSMQNLVFFPSNSEEDLRRRRW